MVSNKNQKIVFGEDWFKENQKFLLFLLNAPIIKIWFRWVLRIRRYDCPLNERITEIAPNRFSYGEKIIVINGKKFLQKTTDFRTHNKFSKRLYYAFKFVWYAMHAWDMVVNYLKLSPRLSFGFDTLTVYPDPGSGATTVDGSVGRGSFSEDFSVLRNGSGIVAYTSTTEDRFALINAHSISNKWSDLHRSIFTFNTAPIPDNANITNAVLSLYGSYKDNGLGGSPGIDIYTATPASNNNLVASDYNQIGTTSQTGSPISYSAFSTTGYNNFTFNTTGRSNINKTGISRFGARESSYDAPNISPPWVSNQRVLFYGYFADRDGTTQDPKLVITYTTPQTFYRTLPATEISVVSLSRAAIYDVLMPAAANSIAAIYKAIIFIKNLSVVEVSVAGLSRVVSFFKALAATEVSVPSLGKAASYLKTLATTSVSVASLTIRKTFLKVLSAIEVSAVSVSRVIGIKLSVSIKSIVSLIKEKILAAKLLSPILKIKNIKPVIKTKNTRKK